MIENLRLLQAIIWIIPIIIFAPALFRLIVRRRRPRDFIKAATWFVATIFIGGTVRWVAYPADLREMSADELSVWAAIYAGSACAGLFLTLAASISDD